MNDEDKLKELRKKKWESELRGQSPSPHVKRYIKNASALRRKMEMRAERYQQRMRKRLVAADVESAKRKAREEREHYRKYERQDMIMAMRERGFTLEEIGNNMPKTISRERVRQLVGTFPPEVQARFHELRKKKLPPVEVLCRYCGKPKLISAYQKSKSHFHLECGPTYGMTKEEVKKARLKRGAARYRNDPVYRAQHREVMRRQREKIKADPVRWARERERVRIYTAKWHGKKQAASLARIDEARKKLGLD